MRFLCSYGMTEAMMVTFNPVDDVSRWSLDSPGYPTGAPNCASTPPVNSRSAGPVLRPVTQAPTPALSVRTAGSAPATSPGFDPDGRLWIIDRIKDMIKVSGFQVAPAEVELALREHPAVHDAGVVGHPDDRVGEIPIAYVVADPELTTAQLEFVDAYAIGEL